MGLWDSHYPFSLMASFVLSFFPLDVLDEIWDLIESVSEGFLTYSFKMCVLWLSLHCLLFNCCCCCVVVLHPQ